MKQLNVSSTHLVAGIMGKNTDIYLSWNLGVQAKQGCDSLAATK